MRWIQTFSGRPFWPLQPRAADIDILDIAHALSLLCRFNGHCRAFYSVAEHSVRVSRILPPDLARWGLLHDAAEAYLSDIPRPLKQQMPAFADDEDRILALVAERFELSWPMPEAVRQADDTLLATERRDLMAPSTLDWRLRAAALPNPIEPVGPAEAESAFLERYHQIS